MERGIVSDAISIKVENGGMALEEFITSQEIRYLSLYWDKLVIPQNCAMWIGVVDEDELIRNGILARPEVRFSGTLGPEELGKLMRLSPFLTAEKLIHSDLKTNWTLHQLGSQLRLPAEFMDIKKILRLELVNLLPVPSGDTPIAEILEFKHQRADELNALHDHIDDIYLEALKAPDQILGANKAIQTFKQDVENLNNVAKEKWWNLSQYDHSIDFSFDAKDVAAWIAKGSKLDAFTGIFSIPFGAIAGGVASCFNVQIFRKATFNKTGNNTKLAFLSDAHKNEIV